MEILRVGSRPSGKGPTDWFTGMVRIDPLFGATATARAAGNAVTFEPGTRTAWHTHPLGQTLIVTTGLGWAQLMINGAWLTHNMLTSVFGGNVSCSVYLVLPLCILG